MKNIARTANKQKSWKSDPHSARRLMNAAPSAKPKNIERRPLKGRGFKKNPTARRGSSRKIKTYYEKTGTKIIAATQGGKAHLGCGGKKRKSGGKMTAKGLWLKPFLFANEGMATQASIRLTSVVKIFIKIPLVRELAFPPLALCAPIGDLCSSDSLNQNLYGYIIPQGK